MSKGEVGMKEEEKQAIRQAAVDRLRRSFDEERERHISATGEDLMIVAAFAFGCIDQSPVATSFPAGLTTEGVTMILVCLAESANEFFFRPHPLNRPSGKDH